MKRNNIGFTRLLYVVPIMLAVLAGLGFYTEFRNSQPPPSPLAAIQADNLSAMVQCADTLQIVAKQRDDYRTAFKRAQLVKPCPSPSDDPPPLSKGGLAALAEESGFRTRAEALRDDEAAATAAAASFQRTYATIKEYGVFELTARDRAGNIAWREEIPNGMADEGEQLFLNCTLRATACPTTYFLRFYNDTPVETDTLSTLTGEATGATGQPTELTRDATGWPTLSLDSGDYQATSASKTVTATGAWGPVTYLVLATSSDGTGKLVSYAALSQSRTLATGESLTVTYKLKLQ